MQSPHTPVAELPPNFQGIWSTYRRVSPKGINVHKLAATKERAVKIHIMTIRHFGFMEKVYGFVTESVRRNGNSHVQRRKQRHL